MNLGGRGCSEPGSCHCTLAWVTQQETSSQKIYIYTKEVYPLYKRNRRIKQTLNHKLPLTYVISVLWGAKTRELLEARSSRLD